MGDRVARHNNIEPHTVLMSVLFVGALIVGYLLLPGEKERIAMLERDGHNRQALTILEDSLSAGDRRQRTLYQSQRLYEHFGELEKARSMLELLAAERPGDASVQRHLAQFYKQTHDEAAYTQALQRQLDLKYSEAGCRELIGIFRRKGDYRAEQGILQSCRQKGYRRTEDMIRLANLLVVDGDAAQASALLRNIDDLKRLKTDRERLQLFAILLDADLPKEAHRRAVRWIKGARDDLLALTLIEMLAREKRHDLAIEIARDVSSPGDSISLTVAELMLDRAQPVAARSYLRGWIEKARFDMPGLLVRFIEAALDAEDPEAAFLGVQKVGVRAVPEQTLVDIAEALAAVGKLDEFDAVRAVLKPETVADNPLLRAAVEMRQGARQASSEALARVDVDELDEWRLALWARLMDQTGRSNDANATLRALGVEREAGAAPAERLKAVRAKGKRTKRTKGTKQAPQPAAAGTIPLPTPGPPPSSIIPGFTPPAAKK